MPPAIPEGILQQLHHAFCNDDAGTIRQAFADHPEIKAMINAPVSNFGSPIIVQVKSKAMLDVLLEAGADINARSDWNPGSFGVLDSAPPEVALYAIERGARLFAHSAARLGLMDKLKELVETDPSVVHSRGGDGQFPLHFASTIEIAEYLLANGADIDARDIDHDSTAAQWMIGERSEIARYLVQRGCHADILMAAALGDTGLAEKLLAGDPECIRTRVSNEYFPLVGDTNGGTIYQWTLGWHVSAVQVAKKFGHMHLAELLMDCCPPEEKLLNACWLHDEALVKELLAADQELAGKLPPAGRRNLAHAARNNDTEAGRLMLMAGLPLNSYSQHHATPLHWAAWHGNAALVKLILDHKPDLENSENDYKGTPLNWAMHGKDNAWDKSRSDHAAVIQALKDAGAQTQNSAG